MLIPGQRRMFKHFSHIAGMFQRFALAKIFDPWYCKLGKTSTGYQLLTFNLLIGITSKHLAKSEK